MMMSERSKGWRVLRRVVLTIANMTIHEPTTNRSNRISRRSFLDGVALTKREAALRKLGAIQACDKRIAQHIRGGGRAADAVAACAMEHGVDRATLFRWKGKYRERGLFGLVDNRGGGKFLGEIINPEAFDLFKSLYLASNFPLHLNAELIY